MRFFFNPVSGQLNAGPPPEIVYSDTAPLYPQEGSRWFDTINLREYVYTGTQWVESGVGPAGVKGDTGDKGDKGDIGNVGPVGPQGPAATVSVGTVTTGVAGINASVSNSGTSGAAVLDFTIPQGAKGDTGNIGPQGPQGIQGVKGDDGASISLKGAVTSPADLTSIAVKVEGDLYVAQSDGNGYVWSGSGWVNVGQIRGPKGDTGAQGPAGPAPAGTGVVVVSNGVTGTPVGYGTTNIADTLVQRDASGNFSAGVITGNLTGNVTGGVTGNVTGNASTASRLATAQTINVSGDVTGTAQSFDGSMGITIPTAIAAGVIVNADINNAAAISDVKLATISTAGKVSNSATTASSANTPSAIVARDTNGNFSAGTITADLFSGNASTASSATKLTTSRNINGVSFDGTSDITISAAPTAHNHDDRYYTEIEMGTLLSGKANLAHTHGNITNAGAIGTASTLPIITGANGVLQAGSFGTTAGTFAEGNKSVVSSAAFAGSSFTTVSFDCSYDRPGYATDVSQCSITVFVGYIPNIWPLGLKPGDVLYLDFTSGIPNTHDGYYLITFVSPGGEFFTVLPRVLASSPISSAKVNITRIDIPYGGPNANRLMTNNISSIFRGGAGNYVLNRQTYDAPGLFNTNSFHLPVIVASSSAFTTRVNAVAIPSPFFIGLTDTAFHIATQTPTAVGVDSLVNVAVFYA